MIPAATYESIIAGWKVAHDRAIEERLCAQDDLAKARTRVSELETELSALRADLDRARRAGERLAERIGLQGTCPEGASADCPDDCAACWLAWAEKEAP